MGTIQIGGSNNKKGARPIGLGQNSNALNQKPKLKIGGQQASSQQTSQQKPKLQRKLQPKVNNQPQQEDVDLFNGDTQSQDFQSNPDYHQKPIDHYESLEDYQDPETREIGDERVEINSLAEQRIRKQRYLEQELAEEVSRDLEEVHIDFNEFEEDSYARRYKKIMFKKWLVLSAACVFFVSVSVAALYQVFTFKEMSGPEIAYNANAYNGTTNFPEYGVENFLKQNITDLMANQISTDNRDIPYSFDDISIDNIYKKSDNLADIYFYTTIKQGDASTKLYFMMPLSWNQEKGTYKSAGEPILTNLESSSNNKEIGESDNLKFNDDAAIDTNTTQEQETFVDNFFKMFYSGQDVSPFYKGAPIKQDKNQKYIGISNFRMYSEPCKAGYNAYAEVTVELPGGIQYKTKKYMLIKSEGKTFTIDGIQ